jgi:hypothetical protein
MPLLMRSRIYLIPQIFNRKSLKEPYVNHLALLLIEKGEDLIG